MKVKKIIITDYESPTLHNWIVFRSPTLEQIEEAIRSLNGAARSSMGIFVTDERLMGIGGGNGVYCCEVQPWVCQLLDPQVPDENNEFVTIMAGQPTEFRRRECVALELVLQAAKYFYENEDDCDPSLKWQSSDIRGVT